MMEGEEKDTREETAVLVQRLLHAVDSRAAEPWAPVCAAPDAFLRAVFAQAAAVPCESATHDADAAAWALGTAAVRLLARVYAALDCVPLRRAALRLVSAPLWAAGRVPPRAVAAAVRAHPHLARMVAAAERRFGAQHTAFPERDALHTLVCAFLAVLERLPGGADVPPPDAPVRYCAAVLALLCTLLCQLPTRRFVHTYLVGMQLMPRLRLAPLTATATTTSEPASPSASASTAMRALRRLVARYEHYDSFPVDDATGAALDAAAAAQTQSRAVQALQAAAHRAHPAALRALVLAGAPALAAPARLAELLRPLPDAACRALAAALGLLPPHPRPGARDDTPLARSRAFLVAVLAEPCRARPGTSAAPATALPLFPTEADLWDPDRCACERDCDDEEEDKDEDNGECTTDAELALPRLTPQYLAPRDYLERHFRVLALDAAAAARDDVETAVKHVAAAFPGGAGGAPVLEGAWRMALPVGDVRVVRVAEPRLGEAVPAAAVLEFGVALGACADAAWRAEWDALRPRDVLFLVALRAGPATRACAAACDPTRFDCAERGVVAVRGCELLDIRDDAGTVLRSCRQNSSDEDDYDDDDDDGGGNGGGGDNEGVLRGTHRRFRVLLDGAQYALDAQGARDAAQQLYAGFSLVVRRRPEQSNCRAVLETLRGLMHAPLPLPDWLSEPLLGFVDSGGSNSRKNKDDDDDSLMTDTEADGGEVVDMGDTFLSRAHLEACHPGIAVTGDGDDGAEEDKGPLNYRITLDASGTARTATAYRAEETGDRARRSSVPFTPAQVRALEAGLRAGLTLVAGAPGTGKCAVAAQLVALLYRAHPAQRTVLVARTNHTLDRVVRRVLALGVDAAHVVRLGHGGAQCAPPHDLSRRGRVDAALARRLVALALAAAVARAAGAPAPEAELVGASCELAGIFRTARLAPLWAQYAAACARERSAAFVAEHFPLKAFVTYVREWQQQQQQVSGSNNSAGENAQWKWLQRVPRGEFSETDSYEEAMALAEGWWAAVDAVFDELGALRVLELVRGGRARADHLLRREARVVALTSTHAALRRAQLAALGVRGATLVLVDAAQMLDAETLVPLVLAAGSTTTTNSDSSSTLRRVVLVGDPCALPPAVGGRVAALRARTRLDTSLFARLLALGAPHAVLDAQGACRPCIAAAYAWACAGGTLRTLAGAAPSDGRNAGFARACQLVDLADARGRGEACPVRGAHQNVAEAEAVVHTYMYMRLRGYPRAAVALLTPSAAQQRLLCDVVARRCTATPALAARYGAPAHITTVDQFQGRRADHVLLSLVRTAAPGTLADPRRLVQALAGARRGLYVFARAALFAAHPALAPVFRPLAAHGTALLLCPAEHHPLPDADAARPAPAVTPIHSLVELAQLVHSLSQQQQVHQDEHQEEHQEQQEKQQQ